jgi:hypothetical protein
MVQPVPRQIITFHAVKEDKIIDIGFQVNLPAVMSIPLPNDEIHLPDAAAKKAGFSNSIFKVISRRFLYKDLPEGIAGAISLVVKPL